MKISMRGKVTSAVAVDDGVQITVQSTDGVQMMDVTDIVPLEDAPRYGVGVEGTWTFRPDSRRKK